LRGFFITFEGIEGSGKSTQVRLLAQHLDMKSYNVDTTREPGEGAIGEEIRNILLHQSNHQMDPLTELFLLIADRNQHVIELIKPSLNEGKIVICDRYIDSSVAYQGFGRGISLDLIHALNLKAIDDVLPDVTYVLDLDVQKSVNRSQTRLIQQDMFEEEGRFEMEHLHFHNKVRQGYLHLAERNPGRIKVFNSDTDVSELAERICDDVMKRITKSELEKREKNDV